MSAAFALPDPPGAREPQPHARPGLREAGALGGARGAERSLLPRAVLPPLWHELRCAPAALGMLAAALRHEDTARAAAGAPAVVLVPGLAAGDLSLATLAAALTRHGFAAEPSGLRCNVDCSGRTLARLTARVERLADHHGGRVALVGHSRGGLLARAVAQRRPGLVSTVVTLGTPHRDQLSVHPALWASLMTLGALGSLGVPGVLKLGCRGTDACCRGFDREAGAPLPDGVRGLSVYSRRDGVVDWRACIDPHGDNLEVDASHLALATDPATLDAVAEALRP